MCRATAAPSHQSRPSSTLAGMNSYRRSQSIACPSCLNISDAARVLIRQLSSLVKFTPVAAIQGAKSTRSRGTARRLPEKLVSPWGPISRLVKLSSGLAAPLLYLLRGGFVRSSKLKRWTLNLARSVASGMLPLPQAESDAARIPHASTSRPHVSPRTR